MFWLYTKKIKFKFIIITSTLWFILVLVFVYKTRTSCDCDESRQLATPAIHTYMASHGIMYAYNKYIIHIIVCTRYCGLVCCRHSWSTTLTGARVRSIIAFFAGGCGPRNRGRIPPQTFH